ncbi:MAG: hypothetical protein JXA54_07375 [Candidatus Heimdallarchaeota archaeon]|nr:hypothetical protein [Candidatus Heimdallarchaeota archaeon]
MKYQEELTKADEFISQGKNYEAAKIFEDIGIKCLREGDSEREAAPGIIAKSIARYMLAGKLDQAQDLAYQVVFMKDEHPFLSLQIESAISSKNNLVRGYLVNKIPSELSHDYEVLKQIPQNRKVMKINNEITIKQMWELTIFDHYQKKYDLIGQKYPSPKDMINFLMSTKTGINIIGAETTLGQKVMIVIATTFNDDPVEIIKLTS